MATAAMSSENHSSSGSTDSDSANEVVIVGAGAIGVCTAYFMAKRGLSVTVVERCGVACAASGKAGGFLALDWSDRSPLGRLARLSFRLHEQMAKELKVDYGYRKLKTLSVHVQEPEPGAPSPQRVASRARASALPEWVDGLTSRAAVMGTEETTAQVHPKLFVEAVLDAAMKKYGAKLVMGEVKDVQVAATESGGERVSGVALADGSVLPAATVVVAMGPWSNRSAHVAQLCTISGLKAHSVVLKPRQPEAITPHALFLQYTDSTGAVSEPEVYPRPDGSVYVCGLSEQVPVPDDPAEVTPRPGASEALVSVAEALSSALAGAEVAAQNACFLPCSDDGLPLIGRAPGVEGLLVGTGHSCWGILNAPATGACLAELATTGTCQTVDLRPFDPLRFQGAVSR